ncbi:M20/M25/M40 family metallo-hydrolase [Marinomonas sp. RS-M-Aa-14]|uniref:M20/M25/M40 family metallo-hydrolase n=1 Tax=Marinomonas sp. RS-M-Aa-14 TaxID=3241169 RepID=UPI003AAD6FEC
MSRQSTIQGAEFYFDSGAFFTALEQRVSVHSESQNHHAFDQLHAYLQDIIMPELASLGFQSRLVANPVTEVNQPGSWPFLIAERIEDPTQLTLLTYGHGDVVRGYDDQWKAGLSPWKVVVDGDRWYGRGTADNKGQHTINFAALKQVIEAKDGKLGFNVKVILEMGEEAGSPGLAELCELYKEELAADLFIASDGPRLSAEHPTIFLGSRGGFNFDMKVLLRDGAHHSGNWGGLLSNAGTRLAHAWASMVDAKGKILVKGLLPARLPESVRQALKDIPVGEGANSPAIDPNWGEARFNPSRASFCVEHFRDAGLQNGQSGYACECNSRLRQRPLSAAFCGRKRQSKFFKTYPRSFGSTWL